MLWRPPLRWLAPLVRGVPLFESAMGDEQRRGRDVAMVAGRRWCAEQERKVEDMVSEALNLLFARYRKAEIAPRS
jgi:hypothetical protein